MMRGKSSSSMQKTYDECYLICSTAVYFEGQNNEAEALRSWRSALDRIYYHNAYRISPDYRPRSETEKALMDSLREMELQCKERVSLLEALRDSRAAAQQRETGSTVAGAGVGANTSSRSLAPPPPEHGSNASQTGWIGQGTVPAVSYPDLARPKASPVPRTADPRGAHTPSQPPRVPSHSRITPAASPKPSLPPKIPVPAGRGSRTPSPDKRTRMRTTLRSDKTAKRTSQGSETTARRPQAASKAAGYAWDINGRASGSSNSVTRNAENVTLSAAKMSLNDQTDGSRKSIDSMTRRTVPPDLNNEFRREAPFTSESSAPSRSSQELDERPEQRSQATDTPNKLSTAPPPSLPHYRKEYPPPTPVSQASITAAVVRPRAYDAPQSPELSRGGQSLPPKSHPSAPGLHRRPVANIGSPRTGFKARGSDVTGPSSESEDGSRRRKANARTRAPAARRKRAGTDSSDANATPSSSGRDSPEGSLDSDRWQERLAYIKKNLPKGVDPHAAKQIFNEIVVQGDEVHWCDVAGLDVAKTALKEAVVYPFLRPDLFMGLREPARGMLLFGPPGTGKTMLARAVATESKSTFFAISASSLTSKWLGESEKLVRALFHLARALAPSIIFVDEIDSLLSSRGGSTEHETTRRVKTEFLIQWSDLQRAAAGKEQNGREKLQGDPTRVLVLAATNCPWAIDEAARRRFVRRQYIPLPEAPVREEQLRTLLSHQKHSLNAKDIAVLVEVTEGYSGSDITALAKDAAMGPLRSLGEALLRMSKDEIRPIQFGDFEASLINIRPSVSQQGLREYEDWARDFGERGG